MGLKEQINEDLKSAMKAKEQVKLRTIRAVRAVILEAEKSKGGSDLDDAAIQELITKQVKQRQESIEIYTKEGRDEQAADEQAELDILKEYLPEALTADEVAAIVKEVIAETGADSPKQMGMVMGKVMAQCKATGKSIDGKLVKDQVNAGLAG